MPTTPSDEILVAAIEGFTAQKSRIDAKIAELRARLFGTPAEPVTAVTSPGKRKGFSAATRKKMALAQKARWAKLGKSETAAASSPEPAKKKRTISADGMKRIIAATKKRWRLAKAAAKTKMAPVKRTAAKKSASVRKVAAKKTAPAPEVAMTETAG